MAFREVAVVALCSVLACTRFGLTSEPVLSSDAGTVDAGAPDVAPATGFCALLEKPATFCDDFSGETFSQDWTLIKAFDGDVHPQTASASPPRSVELSLRRAGCDANGDFAALTLNKELDAGRLLLTSKLNIDAPAGINTGAANGGPVIETTGLGGICAFYVQWQGGLPKLSADVLLAGGPPVYVAHSTGLLTTPLTHGEWLELKLDLTVSSGGSHILWTAGAAQGDFDVPECNWNATAKVKLVSHCSDGPFSVGVDDLALWSNP